MGKNPVSEYMAKIGKAGGEARAKALSPERRSELARFAINARWRRRNGAALSNGPTAPVKPVTKKGKRR